MFHLEFGLRKKTVSCLVAGVLGCREAAFADSVQEIDYQSRDQPEHEPDPGKAWIFWNQGPKSPSRDMLIRMRGWPN